MAKSYYVLVLSHTDGMALYEHLRKQGYQLRIAPAPRAATSCCGMSLLVNPEDIKEVRVAIERSGIAIDRIVELENQIDPLRDRYC